jgi:DNA-binding PucR family transcriptional regulator
MMARGAAGVTSAAPRPATMASDGHRGRDAGVQARALPASPDAAPATDGLVERLRAVHLEMLDAVLSGDGLQRVAELAARAAGAPVAIAVPRLGAAVAAPEAAADAVLLGALGRYVADRLRERPAEVPAGVVAEEPVASGDERLGAVVMLLGGRPDPRAREFLHLAAVASLTEVAIADAREEVEHNMRGSFLEELRSRRDLDPREIVRRAARLGCDLARGAVVLCAELRTDRPRHVVATVAGEHPGALAQHMDGRVYALLPATGGDEAPEATLQAARRVAARLGRHGTVGMSSFYADPAEFSRAVQEAELVLDVLRQSDAPIAEDIGTGTYRLLFRVLASHPEEVRSFYEDTVAPIVAYDDQYATDLVGTLDAYLEQNCNMNATAATIFAHRHTVAYRLDRVRELTGLDPMQSEDRERLGLGLKAYRIIAPRLPK